MFLPFDTGADVRANQCNASCRRLPFGCSSALLIANCCIDTVLLRQDALPDWSTLVVQDAHNQCGDELPHEMTGSMGPGCAELEPFSFDTCESQPLQPSHFVLTM